MRDHLLGCHQFQAVESSDDYEIYGLGVPRRVKHRPAKIDKAAAKFLRGVIAFNEGDHMLAGMSQNDFPHEYDLDVMLGDSAARGYGKTIKVGVDLAADKDMAAVRLLEKLADEFCGIPVVTHRSPTPEQYRRTLLGYPYHGELISVRTQQRADAVAEILRLKQQLRPKKAVRWE